MYACMHSCMYVCISRKKHGFPAFSQRGRPKTLSFSRFSAKGCRKPKPAKKPAGGIEPGTPVLRHRLPKTTFSGTSSNCRAVRGGPPPPPTPENKKTYVIDVGRGGGVRGGGVILYPLVSIRHAEQCRRINQAAARSDAFDLAHRHLDFYINKKSHPHP